MRCITHLVNLKSAANEIVIQRRFVIFYYFLLISQIWIDGTKNEQGEMLLFSSIFKSIQSLAGYDQFPFKQLNYFQPVYLFCEIRKFDVIHTTIGFLVQQYSIIASVFIVCQFCFCATFSFLPQLYTNTFFFRKLKEVEKSAKFRSLL